MARSPRVIIVGGGIGGMTAALALHQRNIEVVVYEQAPALGEVGAGLQLGPNAVRVLNALGLERELLSVASEPEAFASVNWDDAGFRFREPFSPNYQAQFGARYLTAHRADVHRLLTDALPDRLVHLGARSVGADNTPGGAVARFDDGSEVDADVVVGADGVHSAVRAALFGADAPRFTRMMAWRCMVPIDCVPTEVGPGDGVHLSRNEFVGWIGPNGHVICYPIRGGALYNIFAGHVTDEWVEESWSAPSTIDELLGAYAGWNDALLAMLAQTTQCFKWGIYDRDPLDHWTVGRVTLLGDAAHAMMPTLAQGAGQSIEDGYTLARLLDAERGDVVGALAAYDAERAAHAGRVQLQSRQQFLNNQKVPPPPPLSRDWIFAHDATRDSAGATA